RACRQFRRRGRTGLERAHVHLAMPAGDVLDRAFLAEPFVRRVDDPELARGIGDGGHALIVTPGTVFQLDRRGPAIAPIRAGIDVPSARTSAALLRRSPSAKEH